nr:alkaline phosphatase family protein [uncultured Rhodoferax sp.]
MSTATRNRDDYVISRDSHSDAYTVWQFDLNDPQLLRRVSHGDTAKFDRTHKLAPIGRYVLEWGPMMLKDYQPCFPFRLFEFDPTSSNPLMAPALQKGLWTKAKFWSYRADFGNPDGAKESYDSGEELMLLPLGGFMLNVIPTMGRGTFQLWNFDPNPLALNSGNPQSADPLPLPYTPQGSFDTIDFDHELIPIGDYVLDRLADTGEYWLWSFDPQAIMPLALPALQQGRWPHMGPEHKLVPFGDYVLDWIPVSGAYRLWAFDPNAADPLQGPVREGVLPAGFDATTTLTMVQQPRTVDAVQAQVPGTMDFMRDKIKHVVYIMLENRSFDHVCGWLYGKDDTGINFIGSDAPFDGASTDMFNIDPCGGPDGKTPQKVMLSQYQGGQLSEQWDLDFLPNDPFHDKSDVMRQLFWGQKDGYEKREIPGMAGFVWNNGVHDVMQTYSPKQLPILNGLARNFAISDAWYCSMPSATDPNRAFAFTGSALGQLNNFQNGTTYQYWPSNPHRQSIWKVLWTNGFTDWKLYHSVEWMNYVHTYHLYLQGTIPSVDTAIAANATSFLQTVDQFKKDALAGTLPAFSFLEPIWIAMTGTTSYHPGADPLAGEMALNQIYDAIRMGPKWKDTLFVITFDEHGGIFDHAPPPYAANPWPNDRNDGFQYDIMGVRVPTILVSPWIKEQTVFRSTTPTAYDSTSILATLLHWAGVPQSRWCMGARVQQAPTFEGVLQQATPRATSPALQRSYDKSYPQSGAPTATHARLNDLHTLMTPRIVAAMAQGRLSDQEVAQLSDKILREASDAASLHMQLERLSKKWA